MNSNDMASVKFDAQLSLKMPKALLDGLNAIKAAHGTEPAELLRRLGEAAVSFHKENGYFAFPVHVVPDAEFLRMVRETPAFGAGVIPGGVKEGAASKTPPKKKSA